ncbi:MAG: type IV secretion system protein [Acetobacteraceae bacterium]
MTNARRLKRAAALLALVALASGGAKAQLVVECPKCHSEVTDTLRWMQQAKDMVASLERMKQQYEAIAHLPDNVMGMANRLTTTPSLQNPFPQAGIISRAMGGEGITDGAAAMMEQNRFYEPQGDDWTAQEMNRRSAATANIQAMAIRHMQAIEERQQSLTEFYAGIEASPDIQQSAAIQARLQLEQNFAVSQQAQAQQLASLVQLQNRVDAQRIEEKQRKDAQELYDELGGNSAALIAQE